MPEYNIYEVLSKCKGSLKTGIAPEEFAHFTETHNLCESDLEAISKFLIYLEGKRIRNTIEDLLRKSRLPLKVPKTFENFTFEVMKGNNVDALRNLKTLAAIYNHKNIIFIGPAGTGKTHLAQALGYECCHKGLRTTFLKATELRDKFSAARRTEKTARCLNSLVRPACLIIDEIGHCNFDKENTRLFFDLIDRRYNLEGPYSTIITSNKMPCFWKDDFDEDDTLLCSLDRIFDQAMIFKLEGESFRGKNAETFKLSTERIGSVE